MRRARCTGVLVLLLLFAAEPATAELVVAGGRLRCDALVWTSGHFWRRQQGGLAQNELVFERGSAVFGITGVASSFVSLRASCDVAVLQPQDVYVDAQWSNGLGLRAGQFKLPLGIGIMADPGRLKLIGHPLMTAYSAPSDWWDMGVMGTWRSGRGDAAVAFINGSGPNALDNNGRKDLCGRAALRPWPSQVIEFAARGYYGWPDTATVAWRTIGIEFVCRDGRVSVQAELQNLASAHLTNNSGYAQFAFDLGTFEPVGGLEFVLPLRQRVDFTATAGINAKTYADRVKAMLDVVYRNDIQGGWNLIGFNVRFQAAM